MSKRAFVTGATGFTGGHLTCKLIREGWEVTALVRENSKYEALKQLGCRLVFSDITDKNSFSSSLKDIDVVFHIAAFYRDEGQDSVFRKVNVEGTRNLLEASLENKVGKFIHCSTVGVHGEIRNPPADEATAFDPGDPYQSSKLEGEQLVYDYIKNKKINGAIFRPVGIYGPGDLRFLKLFKMANAKVTITLGKGKVLYHLTYIDDLVDGIVLLAENPQAGGEIFILAGPEYTTISELLKLIADTLGKKLFMIKIPVLPVYMLAYLCETACKLLRIKPILYRRRLDFFLKDRAFTTDKAKNLLGYCPKVYLKEGLKKTAQWYKGQGYL